MKLECGMADTSEEKRRDIIAQSVCPDLSSNNNRIPSHLLWDVYALLGHYDLKRCGGIDIKEAVREELIRSMKGSCTKGLST